MPADSKDTSNDPVREDRRFPFAVPLRFELSNGLFRRSEYVQAILVDLSKFGAALIMTDDPRLRIRKRYRVEVDDHGGIVEIRNVVKAERWLLRGVELPPNAVRVGVIFRSMGLELQELVADSVQHSQIQTSRLDG